MLTLASDQAAAIETQIAAVGMAVVSDEAVAVGITAVPTLITESASSLWFLHQYLMADESNLTDRTRGQFTIRVDSKAMRKVEIGQDIIVVIENFTAFGSVTTVAGRQLVKNN